MITLPSIRLMALAGAALLAGNTTSRAQTTPNAKAKPLVTTVYLVRHAEKDSTSDPADPTLSAVGQVRAEALRQLLARRRPAGLFTTDTKRTRATLAPLAAATKLEAPGVRPQAAHGPGPAHPQRLRGQNRGGGRPLQYAAAAD
ncbi:MAG: hypothetical protein NVSMB30_08020 [Hymenobacter sp.]